MDPSVQSKAKFGLEKQEHLVKLAILTTAAILCKFFSRLLIKKSKKKAKLKYTQLLRLEHTHNHHQFIMNFLDLQHSPHVFFRFYDLRALFMNSIRISIIAQRDF